MKFRRYLKRASTSGTRSLQPALKAELRSAKTRKVSDAEKTVVSKSSDEHEDN